MYCSGGISISISSGVVCSGALASGCLTITRPALNPNQLSLTELVKKAKEQANILSSESITVSG